MAIANEKHAQWFALWQLEGMHPLKAYKQLYPNCADNTASAATGALKKRYQTEVYQLIQDGIQEGSAKAFRRLVAILDDDNAPAAVQLKAAAYLLDAAGHKAVERKEITIADKTEEEIDARLMQLMKKEAIDAEIA